MTSSPLNPSAASAAPVVPVVAVPTLSVHAIGLNAIGAAASEFSRDVIRLLAAKHGFNADAAISEFVPERASVTRLDPKRKAKRDAGPKRPAKPIMVLPWVGIVRAGCCSGLRYNHGLFTQCANGPLDSGKYCVTCQKQSDTSSTAQPTFGDVSDRSAVGAMEFRDPKGKAPLPYANVMDKLSLSKDSAQSACQQVYGCAIPEEQFVTKLASRGRPKSSATSSSSSGEGDKKRGRGRPAKKLKLTQSQVGDDLIASLVAGGVGSAPAPLSPWPALQVHIPTSPASSDGDFQSPNGDASDPVADEKEACAVAIADLAAEKEAKDAEKAAEKSARDEVKREAKELKETEKAAKEAAKAVRDEEKRKAKELKEAEKAEKAAAKAVREEEKRVAKEQKDAEKAAKEQEKALKTTAPAPAEPQEPVKFTHEGVEYLKHEEGLYHPTTGDLIGVWNDVSGTVGPVPEDDSDDEDSSE